MGSELGLYFLGAVLFVFGLLLALGLPNTFRRMFSHLAGFVYFSRLMTILAPASSVRKRWAAIDNVFTFI